MPTLEPDGSAVTPTSPTIPTFTSPVKQAQLVAPGTTASKTITIDNPSNRSLEIILSTTVASGGNTVQVTINELTPDGFRRALVTGAAVAAVAITSYKVSPELPAVTNLTAQDILPKTIEVVITVAGTVAYGVDYALGQ